MALSPAKLHLFNLYCKLMPPSRCQNTKVRLLRWAGAKVGKNVSLFSPRILGNFDLIIGDNVFLGHEAMIMGASGSKISLGDFCKVGSRAVIVTGSHKYSIDYPSIAGPGISEDVIIGKGASVETNSIVCPGKTVGEKAHVAAGAVVTHDVPAFTRVAGVPARVIKNFKDNE